jgi:adenylate cyclase
MISEEVRTTAGLSADALPQQQVEIRGRTDPMTVRIVASTKMLLPLTDAAAA